MKTIEERAKAFCENNICVDCGDRKNCDRGCVGCCIPTFSALEWLIQFGKSEHTGLTRWHDPKEELPDGNRDVLIKTTLCTKYRIAFYKANETRNYHWHENNGAIDDDMVIGWREIQE